MKNNIYAVILAGGSGTRFWPLSRKSRPKQFLKIIGQRSLFEKTLARIKPKVPGQNILIVTNAAYLKIVKAQSAGFGITDSNILLEPSAKNTAPAICWAASRIRSLNPDGIMMVLPSDHWIRNTKAFLDCMNEALRLAAQDYLVTIGIVPTRPETGYGYLKVSPRKVSGKTIVFVSRFLEKPSVENAKKFLKAKNYLWNGGIFIWKAEVILKEFKKNLPQVYDVFGGLAVHHNGSWLATTESIKKHWPHLPSISIDYGILEKASPIVTVPAAKMIWSDLGSWEALFEALPKDKSGNHKKGNILDVGCKNSLLWSENRCMTAIGLENIIAIDTPDAVLICRKDLSQKVRDVVNILKAAKQD